MSKQQSISVFFPAYNEAKNIEKTVLGALKILPEITQEYEAIVIDDGSTDNTRETVQRIAKKNHHVRLLSHKKNQGYGASLKSGFYNAKFSLIAFTDSDGQFDFEEVKNFLAQIDSADLVIGYRKKRVEGFVRVFNAKSWTALIFLLFGLRVRDIDCGFKLIKKKVIDKIPRLESDGAFVSAELLVKSKRMGFKIKEVPVNHYPRGEGKPSGANFKVIAKAFRDLFELYPKLKKLS